MRLIDIFRVSVRMLATNALRTFLTVLGIGTAITLIVVLVGLGYGVQNITIGSIVRSQSLLSLDITSGPDEQATPLNSDVVSTFRKVSGVSDVSPVMTTQGQLKFNDKLASVVLKAGTKSFLSMQGIKVSTGRAYADGANEIILSPQTLSLISARPEDILNHTLDLKFVSPTSQNLLVDAGVPVTVVGIVADDNDAGAYVPFSLVSSLKGAAMTSIKTVSPDRNGLVHAEQTIQEKGYTVNGLLDTLDSARSVFNWVTFGLVVIAMIALVVAAIGMFNTLTIALLERTREIGIMKAIGLSKTDIRGLFLSEAIMIGFLGGMAGVGTGLAISRLLTRLVNDLAVRYGGTTQLDLFQFPTGFLLGMLAFPLVLGAITGFYPAVRAARLNPLQALRYE